MPDTVRSSPIRGLSRRDFLKYSSFLAALIGLDQYGAPAVAAALENAAKKPLVIWSQFQECTGCTVNLLQTTAPTPGQLLLEQLSVGYQETAMAAAGNFAEKSLEESLALKPFWVCEGSIATKIPEAMSIAGKTSMEIAKDIYPKVAGAIAIGSCASFGNVQASNPNPTGAMGLRDYLRGPGGIADAAVVNLPRCPGNADDLVATLTYILVMGKLPDLNANGNPLFLYGQTIHDNCERRGHFEAGEFVEQFGDENTLKKYCLYKVGCKGPVTYAPCSVNRWNGKVSWCVESGGPCTGCAMVNFWDDLAPFTKPVPNASLPGIGGINPATIGWGIAGLTAVGLGIHFIGQVATGRLFKGGPVEQPTVTEITPDATRDMAASGFATSNVAEGKAMQDLEKGGATKQEAADEVLKKEADADKAIDDFGKGGDA